MPNPNHQLDSHNFVKTKPGFFAYFSPIFVPNPIGRLISICIMTAIPATGHAACRVCGVIDNNYNNVIRIDWKNTTCSNSNNATTGYLYSTYGSKYNLKTAYDYVCLNAGILEPNGYNMDFLELSSFEYKCGDDKMLGTAGCEPCPTGARATQTKGQYHTNPSGSGCDWCIDEYYYDYQSFYKRCHYCGDKQNVQYEGQSTYHQQKRDYCDCIEDHYKNWATNTCHRCPCNGHNSAHMPLDECYLEAGQTCADETGTYTATESCYGYYEDE